MLEGLGWVASAKVGDRFDYTCLFRMLGGLGGGLGVYDGAVDVFGLGGLDEGAVGGLVEGARGLVSRVRGERRGLIAGLG